MSSRSSQPCLTESWLSATSDVSHTPMMRRRLARPDGDRMSRAWRRAANSGGLTALEVASGMVVGQGTPISLPDDPGVHPLARLRRLAQELLRTPPCVVAFSGGRDSSVLLAVLADVARREGLSPPIAVTARWDDDEASDEAGWQDAVIRAVGIQDWEFLRPGRDLDLLGPAATEILGRVGLLWPAPAYVMAPLARVASGGVLLSGEGGDEAFGLWRYGRLWSQFRSGRKPTLSDLRALVLSCSPRPVRRWRWMRQRPPYQSWLRPEVFRRLAGLLADDLADDPLRWDQYQRVSRGRRAVELTESTLVELCAAADARFVAPFLDLSFLSSLAIWGGWFGRGDRTEVMASLFSDLLPPVALSRTSKATFGGVLWGPASRQFAREWDGTGLDDLVDPELLRQAWLASLPVYGSALPLHAAWLCTRGKRSS